MNGVKGLSAVFAATMLTFMAPSLVLCGPASSKFFTEEMVSDAFENANTIVMEPAFLKILTDAMKAVANNVADEVVQVACAKHPQEPWECADAVKKYVKRCSYGGCFKLDDEEFDDAEDDKVIKLPNRYQLDAAFTMYKVSDVFPISGFRENLMMQMRKGGRYVAYNQFVLILLLANVTEVRGSSKMDNFMRKYLFLAAIYYKTYLMLDNWKARAQNATKFTHALFAKGIQAALTQIIANNISKSLVGINAEEIKPYMRHFPDYIATFRFGYENFAKAYTGIVVITLRSSITNIRHLEKSAASYLALPWINLYKRVLKPVMDALNRFVKYSRKMLSRSAKFAKNGVKSTVARLRGNNNPDEAVDLVDDGNTNNNASTVTALASVSEGAQQSSSDLDDFAAELSSIAGTPKNVTSSTEDKTVSEHDTHIDDTSDALQSSADGEEYTE